MAPASSILSAPALLAQAAASRPEDLIAWLLIAVVVGVIGGVAVLRWVVIRELNRRDGPARRSETAFPAALFDAPNRWLAVRSQHPRAIQEALGLQHARDCTWSDALNAPFEPRLFITPPVDGWVLVMGCDLPDPADDIDECFKFLCAVSDKLGEVQFFSRHRAVSHHGWALLNSGKVLRAYAWAGETLWNQGPVTQAERDLKMRCLAYMQSSNVLGLAERELLALNTERVTRLAARWSVDPAAIERALLEEKGIAGDLLHGRYP